MRVLLLHNPEAGDGPDCGAELMRLLRTHGHDPIYCSAKRPGWKRALHADCDLIAVCGGDGTIAKVLRRLEPGHPAVAILPRGSANNISHSLGISRDTAAWIAGWETARRQPFACPLLRTGQHQLRFVEAAGLGVFSAVIAAAAEDEPRGEAKVEQGVCAFVDHLQAAREQCWRLEVDGVAMDAEGIMLEVLNVPRIGPRLDLSHGTTPGAGTVDVVCVPAASRGLLIEALRAGAAVPAHAAVRHRGRDVRIAAGGGALHVDDALWAPAGPIHVQCGAAGVTLLCPG
jgi:diacylglycerol kinase (ATP)